MRVDVEALAPDAVEADVLAFPVADGLTGAARELDQRARELPLETHDPPPVALEPLLADAALTESLALGDERAELGRQGFDVRARLGHRNHGMARV